MARSSSACCVVSRTRIRTSAGYSAAPAASIPRRREKRPIPLSSSQARAVYDRLGRLQDSQSFYEDAALERMVVLGDLAGAGAIFELGCGTGRLADRLLAGELPVDATYLATDISPRMTEIAEGRLERWSGRARVVTLDPRTGAMPGDDGTFDRFIATYVFDLLDQEEADRLLAEARRLLGANGRICLVGITPGSGGLTRLVMGAWGQIAARFPAAVGGCRPIDSRRLLDSEDWTVLADESLSRWGVSSQIVIGEPR